jgi:hypothetical protein
MAQTSYSDTIAPRSAQGNRVPTLVYAANPDISTKILR